MSWITSQTVEIAKGSWTGSRGTKTGTNFMTGNILVCCIAMLEPQFSNMTSRKF